MSWPTRWLVLDLKVLNLYQTDLCFNSLLNNKIWDMKKLRAFADDKLTKMTISLFDRVGNTVCKGESACY